jgi:hypothetical protein
MKTIYAPEGEKVHTRNISVSTYDCDGQRILVEGIPPIRTDEVWIEPPAGFPEVSR